MNTLNIIRNAQVKKMNQKKAIRASFIKASDIVV